jgi:predicted O-linked N-acetylglucosamine transferase (SPINDLY family)
MTEASVKELAAAALDSHLAGNLAQAEQLYRQVLEVEPDNAGAPGFLGALAYQAGRLEEAAGFYRRAAELKPNSAALHHSLGNVLHALGRTGQANAAFRRATECDPNHAEAHFNLGNGLFDQHRFAEAAASYRRALAIRPHNADALCNLGNVLEAQGQLDEAVAAYRSALALRPDLANVHNNLGNIEKERGLIAEAAASYRRALAINPTLAGVHSNLLFALNYAAQDAAALFAGHLGWARQHAEPLTALAAPHGNVPDPLRRLRIGYVSADLREHPVARFIEPVLAQHDRGGFEIFCYANDAGADEAAARLRAASDHWRCIAGLGDAAAEAMIREDAIDILVDLSGHTARNRLTLFARKPAPVQATWIGYPNTTGMSAMDYRLTDARADPPGTADSLHSETLLRLPRTFLCYRPEPASPAVAPLPAARAGYVTFGSFNNLPKITPEVVAVWARILARLPQARLLLKSGPLADATARSRYLALFAEHGIAAPRITLAAKVAAVSGHLALYGEVDIGLDPFPYNGTTTTCEAMWMGVPVVALAGDRHAGRVGVSLLGAVGLEELVAKDEEAYVEKAVALASDLERLAGLRAGLRARMQQSPLCDEAGFTRALEDTWRAIWQTWCGQRQ